MEIVIFWPKLSILFYRGRSGSRVFWRIWWGKNKCWLKQRLLCQGDSSCSCSGSRSSCGCSSRGCCSCGSRCRYKSQQVLRLVEAVTVVLPAPADCPVGGEVQGALGGVLLPQPQPWGPAASRPGPGDIWGHEVMVSSTWSVHIRCHSLLVARVQVVTPSPQSRPTPPSPGPRHRPPGPEQAWQWRPTPVTPNSALVRNVVSRGNHHYGHLAIISWAPILELQKSVAQVHIWPDPANIKRDGYLIGFLVA